MKTKLFVVFMTLITVNTLFVSCNVKSDESDYLVGTVWMEDDGFQRWCFEFTTTTSGVMNYDVESENIHETLHFTYYVKGRERGRLALFILGRRAMRGLKLRDRQS